MDTTYQLLAQRLQREWIEKQSQGQKRLLIALAGPPGSGKTTIAQHVVDYVAALQSSPSIVAISADGFHLSLAALRALPNAAEAFARRGAPWTFDGAAVVDLVRNLRAGAGQNAVMAPTFDHAIKDPVTDGLTVGLDTEVCILEGNYLLSDEAPWNEIADIVDDRWLVKVDPMLARNRVAARHLRVGIEDSMEKALKRAEENDMVNGEYVMRHSHGRYDVLIESLEESAV
ncbi:Phosphoribulokinase uridine kinase family protein [Pleurostoma richardsiae]|uniref:Phosphoribulokinase uridine kinase family protein n=1 Tax=Pleurostoma richardsiae TaxID=41990 RepID=A0AA38R568_9PEZI|nr:Phosphoribulokinase uridine kinase family protein [Pleurostoma richardsiae]